MNQPICVIIPTYKEFENLTELVARLGAVRSDHALDLVLWVMDDNSQDGTDEWFANSAPSWARLIVRKHNRGLSAAVIDGLTIADGHLFVVMDADLSHPPEMIPEMISRIESGAEFVIGSRYVAGGGADAGWGFVRWLNSKVATILARPFTNAKDPMAGFFAFRKAVFDRAEHLQPIGYKIGLELIVKCRIKHVVEVPIHFEDRKRGHSKLNLAEQINYLKHLRHLAIFKYGEFYYIGAFGLVGLSGIVVNLAVLTLLLAAGVSPPLAYPPAIGASIVSNFVFNRILTFRYALGQSIKSQFVGFLCASMIGAIAQYLTACSVDDYIPSFIYQGYQPQMAALVGILVGFVFNFLINRHFVFRQILTAKE